MYQITDAVHSCYTQIGRFKNIDKEVLQKRLSANVDVAPERERIFENQNKWIYRLGSCEIKVDHDTNTIYQIKWVEKKQQVPIILCDAVKKAYRRYGLNKMGTGLSQ